MGRAPADRAAIARPIRADVVVDTSVAGGRRRQRRARLAAGNRAFVLATTGWDADVARVRALLLERRRRGGRRAQPLARRGAVPAARGDRGRLVRACRRLRAVDRRVAPARQGRPAVGHGASDRPPDRRRRPALGRPEPGDAGRRTTTAPPHVLEVAGIRAGAAPGTHLVTFDGPGESVELRLSRPRPLRLCRRARSPPPAGSSASPASPGLHPFDDVVDDLLRGRPLAVPARA